MARVRTKDSAYSPLNCEVYVSQAVRDYAHEHNMKVKDAAAYLIKAGLHQVSSGYKPMTIGYQMQSAYLTATDEMKVVLNTEQRDSVWDGISLWMIRYAEQLNISQDKIIDTIKEVIHQELGI